MLSSSGQRCGEGAGKGEARSFAPAQVGSLGHRVGLTHVEGRRGTETTLVEKIRGQMSPAQKNVTSAMGAL